MRHNPGGPPGDPDDDGGGDGPDESEEDTPVHSDDAARPLTNRKEILIPMVIIVDTHD